MKKIVKIILYNLLIFVGIILLLEGAVRVLIPEIQIPPGTEGTLIARNVYLSSNGLAPNSSGRSHGVLKKVDSNGFLAILTC